MNPNDLPIYIWPDLSSIERQYLVTDDQGRYGIAYHDPARHADVIFAHPVNVPEQIDNNGSYPLPANAIMMTNTVWHVQPDGSYSGKWFDTADYHRLTIITDLGWRLPDIWANQALAGSAQMGHWHYGATLGKIGGEPPVKGQISSEMTITQAVSYVTELHESVSVRGLRQAAHAGNIPGARKIGRDWLIPYEGLNYYLDNRPRRGPKSR